MGEVGGGGEEEVVMAAGWAARAPPLWAHLSWKVRVVRHLPK